MIRRIALTLAAATALLAAPALADWEKTHWGDGVDKVIADVGEGAKPDKGDEDDRVFDKDRLASRDGSYNGINAVWQFFFDGKGGLAVVKVKPRDYADCDPFVAKVKAEQGKLDGPNVKDLGTISFSSWTKADRKANLAVMVVQVSGIASGRQICHITYQPYGSGKPGQEN